MTMTKTAFALMLLLLSCFSLPSPSRADDRVYVDITASSTRKINFAVPWFANAQGGQDQSKGKELADTLAKALEFHGVIGISPTAE